MQSLIQLEFVEGLLYAKPWHSTTETELVTEGNVALFSHGAYTGQAR